MSTTVHIRGNSKGAITLEYKLVDNNTTIQYGVAFCSSRDQFCRKEGRRIAQDRLFENGFKSIPASKYPEHRDIVLRCLMDILVENEYPVHIESLLYSEITYLAGFYY